MDWQALVIFVVIIIVLFYVTGRRRRKESPRLASALNAISNVNDDIHILETHFVDRQSPKKFKNSSLAEADDRLNFLDAPTLSAVKETYTITRDFNEKIDEARKAKALPILRDLPFEKLTDPLNTSKAGLVAWLRVNIQTESQNPRRNFLGF
jgi:hypothetical protein